MSNPVKVAKQGYKPSMYVHIAITLLLMFGFGYLPPFSTLTPVGMKLLGLFLGVIYGYSTCEVIWPSLFAFIAFGLSGYVDMNTGIASMLGGSTVFQIITQYFTAGAIVIYGFGGILLSLMMGGAMIPYKSWQLGLANTWLQVTGGAINLGFMFLITGICGTIIITAYVFLGAKLFKVDFSIMEAFDVDKLGDESKHLRPRTKRILVVYLITMVLAIFAGTFLNNPLSDFLNNTLTTGGLYCVCSAILMVLPSGEGDGQAAINFNDIKHSDSAVSWPVILMCAVTIPLATALTDEVTGVLPWLTGIFTPVFEGRGPVFILIFTIVVMLILTNVGSNIAFGGAMIPVVSPFVIASGMNPVVAGAALIWIANMGLVLPGASAPASIFHGRSELPSAKVRTQVVLFSAALLLVVSIVVFAIFYLLTA